MRAILGPTDDGLYEFDWKVSHRSYVRCWFENGGLEEVDVVPGYDIRFDSADWRSACAERRRCMLSDLLASGRLEGIDLDACLVLLGPDSDTRMFRDLGELVYDLGGGRLWMDSEWLVLDFEEGQLVRTRLVED